MKRMIIPLLMVMIVPALCFSQPIDNIDYISPFNENIAAIKKGNLWAFIDTSGTMLIDFREDVVVIKKGNEDYPIFNNDRCLISLKKDGISYFGYIDKTGKTVIEPQFLNATPFKNNAAVALKLTEEVLGENNLLDKKVITYKYYEVVIDNQGSVKNYLDLKGTAVALDKKSLYKPPIILRHLISDNLYTYMDRNKKWVIEKIE